MKIAHAYTEAQMVEGCQKNDPRFQKLVYDKFGGTMLGVCMRYANNRYEAEDILQEGFIKVFTKCKSFKSQGSFEGWIRRVMVTTSLEYYRKNLKSNLMVDIDDHHESLKGDSLVFTDYDTQKLLDAIKSLSHGYRMVFNLYVVEGYNHKEIGEMLGISEGTSKSQLARSKGVLKEILRKEGIVRYEQSN